MMDLMQKAREIAAGVWEQIDARGYARRVRAGTDDCAVEVQSAHIALQQGEKLAEALRAMIDPDGSDPDRFPRLGDIQDSDPPIPTRPRAAKPLTRPLYASKFYDAPEVPFEGLSLDCVVSKSSVEPEPHDLAFYTRLQALWDAQGDVYDSYHTHRDKDRYTAEMDALDAAFQEQQA